MANTTEELRNNTILELRRGMVVLAVLNQLRDEQYGYSLIKLLADKGFEIDQGTLYPLLRRLEAQGLLLSKWRVEADRPRRYYAISAEGEKILPQLKAEYHQMVQVMDEILK